MMIDIRQEMFGLKNLNLDNDVQWQFLMYQASTSFKEKP